MESFKKLCRFIAAKMRGNSVARYLYLKAALWRPAFNCPEELLYGKQHQNAQKKKMAFICDEMTWQDFSAFGNSIFLHPGKWKKQLKRFRPDVLFCESAWSGIDQLYGVWQGRIYRDKRVKFENRDVLLKILAYCRDNGIPTVFWNKEDPIYHQHEIYDFADTAIRFDYLFTTAEETVERYKLLGHGNVRVLPFGVDCARFHPGHRVDDRTALFAGGWYGDIPERCADLRRLLDYAIEKGWGLTILDRNSENPGDRFRFPEQYQGYIRPAVPYAQIPEIYRQYRYVINVNTVTNSNTMMSRRMLQLAASGATIISNNSRAFERFAACLKIWRETEDGPVYAVGIQEALAAHSTENRFRYVMETVDEAKRCPAGT